LQRESLFLPFADCGEREATPGVDIAAFGIEDTALYSGLVQAIFKKQTSTEREPNE
jgi:hypothetical protein